MRLWCTDFDFNPKALVKQLMRRRGTGFDKRRHYTLLPRPSHFFPPLSTAYDDA